MIYVAIKQKKKKRKIRKKRAFLAGFESLKLEKEKRGRESKKGSKMGREMETFGASAKSNDLNLTSINIFFLVPTNKEENKIMPADFQF